MTSIASPVPLIREAFKISSLLFWDALSFSFTGNAWLFVVSTFSCGSSALKPTESLKVFSSASATCGETRKYLLGVYFRHAYHNWIFEKMLLCKWTCQFGVFSFLDCLTSCHMSFQIRFSFWWYTTIWKGAFKHL